jgi:hypothetical protein
MLVDGRGAARTGGHDRTHRASLSIASSAPSCVSSRRPLRRRRRRRSQQEQLSFVVVLLLRRSRRPPRPHSLEAFAEEAPSKACLMVVMSVRTSHQALYTLLDRNRSHFRFPLYLEKYGVLTFNPNPHF